MTQSASAISSPEPSFSDDLTSSDYVVVGVATCFVKADGEVQTVNLLEPVPSAYLEVLLKGVPTSYRGVCAIQLGNVLSADGLAQMPDLPLVSQQAPVQLCEDFAQRLQAAARTYQTHPHIQQDFPVGTTQTEINFSTEKKRVLNNVTVINDDDNVKQHAYTHQRL